MELVSVNNDTDGLKCKIFLHATERWNGEKVFETELFLDQL